jgi:predicted PurR-regulated permease PerM
MSKPDSAGGRMPPWLPRAYVLALATVVLLGVAIWALLQLRGLLLLLFVALFVALAVEPAVNRLAERGWRRGLATGLIFLVLGLLIGLFIAALGSVLVSQITKIVHGIPEYVEHVLVWINHTFHTRMSQADMTRYLNELRETFSKHLTQVAGNVWGIGTTALGGIFQAFTVLLFAFYLSAEGPRVRRALCSLLPPDQQRAVLRAWEIAVDKTGGYIYSRVLLAVASGIAHLIALSILRVPFAFALALWVGVVSQFIPTIGTYLAGVLPVLVALTQSPLTALWVLLFVLAYQQFENYVLQPHVTAKTVDIHPAVAFGAVIAGAALIGPIGALLAIPAWASVQSFAAAYIRRYEVADHPLTTEPPEQSGPGHARRTADPRPDSPARPGKGKPHKPGTPVWWRLLPRRRPWRSDAATTPRGDDDTPMP